MDLVLGRLSSGHSIERPYSLTLVCGWLLALASSRAIGARMIAQIECPIAVSLASFCASFVLLSVTKTILYYCRLFIPRQWLRLIAKLRWLILLVFIRPFAVWASYSMSIEMWSLVLAATASAFIWPNRRRWILFGAWILALPFTHYWPAMFSGALLSQSLDHQEGSNVSRVLGALVFGTLLTTSFMAEGRYVPDSRDSLDQILTQPGVSLATQMSQVKALPFSKMDSFCLEDSAQIFVTPHAPYTNLAMVDINGRVKSVFLGGEATDRSWVEGGEWYTVVGAAVTVFDTASLTIKRVSERRPPLSANAFFVNGLSGVDYVTTRFDMDEYCRVYDKKSLREIAYREVGFRGFCQPLNNELILSSYEPVIEIWEKDTGRSFRSVDVGRNYGPFFEVMLSSDRTRVYSVSSKLLYGELTILDSRSLKPLKKLRIPDGIRGLLADPYSNNIFAWEYFSGRIWEIEPDGRAIRSWKLGPLLRNLRWDCNSSYLLAGTNAGIFRIQVR